jgi:hypothetical protein
MNTGVNTGAGSFMGGWSSSSKLHKPLWHIHTVLGDSCDSNGPLE